MRVKAERGETNEGEKISSEERWMSIQNRTERLSSWKKQSTSEEKPKRETTMLFLPPSLLCYHVDDACRRRLCRKFRSHLVLHGKSPWSVIHRSHRDKFQVCLLINDTKSFNSFIVESFSTSVSFVLSKAAKPRLVNPSLGPSSAPGPSPFDQGPSVIRRPRRHHRQSGRPYFFAAPPSEGQDCDQKCMEPLTVTLFRSTCSCVFPMKVRLMLDVALYAVFPVMNELEIEVASGIYMEQSQVKIMGATADNQNQERTVVDINLVPLGEKFDNTTAFLTYERFWQQKVTLNRSLFGDYAVMYISYPGIPSPPPFGSDMGSYQSGNASRLPFTAIFIKKNQNINLRTIIIIALSTFVLMLVLLGAFVIFLRWRKVGRPSRAVGPAFKSSINKRSGMRFILSSSITSSTSMSLMSNMATSILSARTFALSELEKATNKFSSKRVLGEGGFGRVYHGTLEDGTEVAVKLLTRNNQNGDSEFIAEVEMLSRLHHCNLVRLIGICIEGRRRCLVYELVPNGSVESHLHGVGQKKGPLDWEARMKVALGAARGLAYLHEDSNPRVIHRDFKASNVLLEDDFTPKVSDFGLAREATEGSNHISTRVMGTFGYVAPEYAMTGHLLVKSDVYSYGVVLLELLTGRKPVDMSQPHGQENLVTWARPLLASREGLEQLVDPSLAGSYDFDDMAKVAAIASMCVHPEVTQRPFMGEVVQALKLIYNDADETCGDYCSQKDSSTHESDFRVDLAPSESSWWNAGGATPRLTYGQPSSFISMDYSSGPLEMENRPFSTSSLNGDEISLPVMHEIENRSGPLKTVRSKLSLYKFIGSRSEHGGLRSKNVWNKGFWV
ncbi:receptor-like serine/threonine-protein kinase ALE2 isoform X1 [Senna tora]|uniref:Receptor-like serine/threonine-protein kinase ALE2 isoform X1 n=1 Tax=Senna tora TaxID=362788 RepID=A0A834TJ70_9FABA|nr:receptor-like serine/threonine-protein kinase ALE2 isoform X1 [Senna tora]